MPTVSLDVDGTYRTVTRPVVLDIIYDLIKSMGIPYNTKVVYPGTSDEEDIPISVNNGEGIDDQYDPRMTTLIEAEERFLEDNVPTTVMNKNENAPIFEDKALGVIIAPIYARCELELTIRMRFPDKNLAEKKMHDIRRYASMHRDGMFHEVKYQYLVPKPPLIVLNEIFQLRENQASYGDEYGQYLRDHFTDRMTTLANRDDSHRALAIDEIQTGLMGFYTFDVLPDPAEATESKATHVLEIGYRINYDKILSVIMQYPLLVHNQPIDSKFYDHSIPFELGLRLQLPSRFRYWTDPFTVNNYITGFPMGAPVPVINDWLPATTPTATEGMLRIMVVVDPEDRRDVADLNDLDEFAIKPEIRQYMMQVHKDLTTPKRAAIFVGLYENNKMLGPEKVEVTEDLHVRSTFDMDIRKHYHVWVAIVGNLEVLTDTAKKILRENGDLLDHILIGIDSTLPERDKMPKRLTGNYVSKEEFQKSVDAINTTKEPIHGSIHYANYRVGAFVTTVHEESEYADV